MKLLQVAEQNKKYYTKDFILGFNTGAKAQYEADKKDAEPIDVQSEIQDILDYLDTVLHPIISPEHWNVYSALHDMISTLQSAQPIDVQEAYYRGKIDGIKECTARLKKVNDEVANG